MWKITGSNSLADISGLYMLEETSSYLLYHQTIRGAHRGMESTDTHQQPSFAGGLSHAVAATVGTDSATCIGRKTIFEIRARTPSWSKSHRISAATSCRTYVRGPSTKCSDFISTHACSELQENDDKQGSTLVFVRPCERLRSNLASR